MSQEMIGIIGLGLTMIGMFSSFTWNLAQKDAKSAEKLSAMDKTLIEHTTEIKNLNIIHHDLEKRLAEKLSHILSSVSKIEGKMDYLTRDKKDV